MAKVKAEGLRLSPTRAWKFADTIFWLVLAGVAFLKAAAHINMWRGSAAFAEYYEAAGLPGGLWRHVVLPRFAEHADRPLAFLADVYLLARFAGHGGVIVVTSAGLITLSAYLLSKTHERNGDRFGAAGSIAIALSSTAWQAVFNVSLATYIWGVFLASLGAYWLGEFFSRIVKERDGGGRGGGGRGANRFLTGFFLAEIAAAGFGANNAALAAASAAVVVAVNFKRSPLAAKFYALTVIGFTAVVAFAYYASAERFGADSFSTMALWAWKVFKREFSAFNLAGLYDGATWACVVIVPLCGALFYCLAAGKIFVWETFGVAMRGRLPEIGRRVIAGLALVAAAFLPVLFGYGRGVFGVPEFTASGGTLFGIDALIAALAGFAILYDAAFDALCVIRFSARGRVVDLWLLKPLGASLIALVSFFALP